MLQLTFCWVAHVPGPLGLVNVTAVTVRVLETLSVTVTFSRFVVPVFVTVTV
jgi:hypothetical protein